MRFLFSAAILIWSTVLMAPTLNAQQPEEKTEERLADSTKDLEGKGKTRDTPFGRVRQDAKPQPAPTPKKPSETGLVRAEVSGDTVTFRRKTPFGNQVWTRKRSELSDDEKEILATQSTAGRKVAAPKPEPGKSPKPQAEPTPSDQPDGSPE